MGVSLCYKALTMALSGIVRMQLGKNFNRLSPSMRHCGLRQSAQPQRFQCLRRASLTSADAFLERQEAAKIATHRAKSSMAGDHENKELGVSDTHKDSNKANCDDLPVSEQQKIVWSSEHICKSMYSASWSRVIEARSHL